MDRSSVLWTPTAEAGVAAMIFTFVDAPALALV
jgi:hypothetical protein